MIRRFLATLIAALALGACGPLDESELAQLQSSGGSQALLVTQGFVQRDLDGHAAVAAEVVALGNPATSVTILAVSAAPSNPGDDSSGTQDPIPVRGRRDTVPGAESSTDCGDDSGNHYWRR